MSLFSDNIRQLRVKKGISQEKLAQNLLITRGRYVKYEDGSSEPPYDILKRMSYYFHVSIDILLSVDVQKIPIEDLLKLGDNRILLPITVDQQGENIIEIIPHKAQAGYLSGYADPEFIESLQHISLPFLRNGKFRAFPVDGDSMPPHKKGSFIVGQYVERLGDVMDGKTYIVITKSQGIVYKRLNKNGRNALMLHSDNTIYLPYEIKASEILEIWEYACSIATNEFAPDDLSTESLKDMFRELRREIREVGNKIN
ncbi:MAG: transcriptional regulator with XRE-family HTH domain [Flavobacterium sp.]|jgi:transcriptional regulator with XRE-family HTH domain